MFKLLTLLILHFLCSQRTLPRYLHSLINICIHDTLFTLVQTQDHGVSHRTRRRCWQHHIRAQSSRSLGQHCLGLPVGQRWRHWWRRGRHEQLPSSRYEMVRSALMILHCVAVLLLAFVHVPYRPLLTAVIPSVNHCCSCTVVAVAATPAHVGPQVCQLL